MVGVMGINDLNSSNVVLCDMYVNKLIFMMLLVCVLDFFGGEWILLYCVLGMCDVVYVDVF